MSRAEKTRKFFKSGSGSSKSGRLLTGAAILAVGNLIAKMLGAFYRVPLTNILGAEGMGMYQLVFPVFALFMTLSTAGIPTALSRIVAEKRALGQSTKKYLVMAVVVLVLISSVAVVLTATLARPLASWQGNPSSALGFIAIAPAILFVGIIAGLRGWFQGQMYMMPTAISNIVEQAVKLGAGIGLAVWLMPRGLEIAVAGSIIGITISELVAMIYLAITYFVRERKARRGAETGLELSTENNADGIAEPLSSGVKESEAELGRKRKERNNAYSKTKPLSGREPLRMDRAEKISMLRVAGPIALVAILMPLSNFFDSLIIVNALKWGGQTTALSTAQYGILSGPVVSLINMPIVIIMSLAVAIVPSVSVSRVEHDIQSILIKSKLSIKIVYLIGVPVALLFMLFGKSLLGMMYPSFNQAEIDMSANLLLIMAPNVILLSAMQIYVSLLQALDKTKSAVLSLSIAIVVKIILSIVLVRFYGIRGAAVASIAMGAVSLAICNIAFVRLTSLHLEKTIGVTMTAGIVMALVGMVLREVVPGILPSIIVGFIVCIILYLWLIMLFGVFSEEELHHLPLGKMLAKIRRKIRFWEYGDQK